MLAEMFMMRFEAMKQESRELGPTEDARFVPFNPAASFVFNEKRVRK
jgi:hypothetical protein